MNITTRTDVAASTVRMARLDGRVKTETGNGRQKLTRTQYSHESLRELATHATEDGSRLLARERQSSVQVTVRLANKSFS